MDTYSSGRWYELLVLDVLRRGLGTREFGKIKDIKDYVHDRRMQNCGIDLGIDLGTDIKWVDVKADKWFGNGHFLIEIYSSKVRGGYRYGGGWIEYCKADYLIFPPNEKFMVDRMAITNVRQMKEIYNKYKDNYIKDNWTYDKERKMYMYNRIYDFTYFAPATNFYPCPNVRDYLALVYS